MNIALAALCLFLLALPGILARLTYRKLIFESPVQFQAAVEEIAFGIVFAAIIHFFLLLALSVADWGLTTIHLPDLWKAVEYRHVLTLISGEDGEARSRVLEAVAHDFWRVVGYLILASITGAAVGRQIRIIVRKGGFDLKFHWLRFPDEWHYILAGEDAAIMRAREAATRVGTQAPRRLSRKALLKQVAAVDMVHVTVVVQQGDDVTLYGGILLRHYYVSGQLDRIALLKPYRLPLPTEWNHRIDEQFDNVFNKDPSAQRPGDLYPIKAEVLVIDYCDVKTLAVQCIELEAETRPLDPGPLADPASSAIAVDSKVAS